MSPHSHQRLALHERQKRGVLNIILLATACLVILGVIICAAAWALSLWNRPTPLHHQSLISHHHNGTTHTNHIAIKTDSFPLMAQTSVVIALIGRDVDSELPYVLKNIEGLSRRFKRSHVVLVENDSSDKSVSTFLSWGLQFNASSSPNTQTSAQLISFKGKFGHKSINGLAFARNKYIEAFVSANKPNKVYDFLIAVDTDMCFAWELNLISRAIEDLLPSSSLFLTHNLSFPTPAAISPLAHETIIWDVLLANGACGWYLNASATRPNEVPFRTLHSSAVYCDLLALRDTKGKSHNMMDTMVWFKPGTCDLSSMNQVSREGFTCQMQGGQPIVPVKAGFGGWGMYSQHLLMGAGGCRHDENEGHCEHDSLNTCITNRGGKIIIATDLVVNWEGCAAGEEWRLRVIDPNITLPRPW
jgi:hypothetical protein